MKIYRQHLGKTHPVFVQPGKQHPETSDFLDANRQPIMFRVEFVLGMAEVPGNLARFMVANGLARSSPIILPPGM